jgi:hypothetical protein
MEQATRATTSEALAIGSRTLCCPELGPAIGGIPISSWGNRRAPAPPHGGLSRYPAIRGRRGIADGVPLVNCVPSHHGPVGPATEV